MNQITTIPATFEQRLAALENDFREHRHTGLDSRKVRVSDLGTVLYKEATINPASLADGAGATISVSIPGAVLGDFVMVAAPYDLQDLTVTAYVQAADAVEIRIQNESTAVVDLASGVWRIAVIKKFI